MNKAKLWKSMVLALALSLALGACSNNGANNNAAGGDPTGGTSQNAPADGGNQTGDASQEETPAEQLPLLTAAPYPLTGTEDGTKEFAELNADYQSPYQNETCWNITPPFMPADTGISVFKYGSSNETFVQYDGAVYAIGGDSTGDGVTSMALADYNADGAYELYYAYSNGSESRVGCFDPAQKAATDLAGKFTGQPIVLSAEGSTMTVCVAEVSDYESLTSMKLLAGDELAKLVVADGKPAIEMTAAE